MKKSIIVFLLLMYMIPVIGVTVSTHYCNNKIASVSFQFLNYSDSCTCGNQLPKKSCCKDETTFFKLNENQHYNTFNLILKADTTLLPFLSSFLFLQKKGFVFSITPFLFTFSPPRLSIPLFIYLDTFLI